MNANSFQEIYILYYSIIDKASRWKTVLKNIVYFNIFKTVPSTQEYLLSMITFRANFTVHRVYMIM